MRCAYLTDEHITAVAARAFELRHPPQPPDTDQYDDRQQDDDQEQDDEGEQCPSTD